MTHASQDLEGLYEFHDLMNRFRGKEFGYKYAEGFVRHAQGPPIGRNRIPPFSRAVRRR